MVVGICNNKVHYRKLLFCTVHYCAYVDSGSMYLRLALYIEDVLSVTSLFIDFSRRGRIGYIIKKIFSSYN